MTCLLNARKLQQMAEFGGNDGHVKLYYNNTDRLETTSDGVDITGKLTGDVVELAAGVTYDPPGSSGNDTATDVALALQSGARTLKL